MEGSNKNKNKNIKDKDGGLLADSYITVGR
jgi:hypothetical protein